VIDTYAEIFSHRADGYNRAMATWPRARDLEFASVIEPLHASSLTIFDMPAGGGYLHSYIPANRQYVAVEPVIHFFDRCPNGGNARRISSAIEQVPSADGAADAIVSLAGLHHVRNLALAFREFRRLLRPNGLLIIADIAEGTPPASFLNTYVDDNSQLGHEGWFLNEQTAGTIEEANFKIEADEIIAVPWTFPDQIDAAAYCAGLFGIEGPSMCDIAVALADIVGMLVNEQGVHVKWMLRRIVGRAV
jgi:SAM-dependent methyltransferase